MLSEMKQHDERSIRSNSESSLIEYINTKINEAFALHDDSISFMAVKSYYVLFRTNLCDLVFFWAVTTNSISKSLEPNWGGMIQWMSTNIRVLVPTLYLRQFHSNVFREVVALFQSAGNCRAKSIQIIYVHSYLPCVYCKQIKNNYY